MSDGIRLFLIFLAAINPPAIALSTPALSSAVRRRAVALALVVAGVIYILAALTAERFLDALDIAPETFRIAAAIVMAPAGMYAIFRARVAAESAEESWRAGVFPLAVPLLVSPAALAAAISIGVDDGAGKAAAALAVPLVLAAGLAFAGAGRWRPAADGLARMLGALLVALAVALVVDGVRAV